MTALQVQAPSRSVSKFSFSDLALRSAVELERAAIGAPYETEPLRDLANVLDRTANPNNEGAPFRFVEPGYYQTFGTLYQLQQHKVPTPSVEQLQQYMGEAIKGLRQVQEEADANQIDRALIAFCIALHRELIRELASEDSVVVHERRFPDLTTSASLR